MGTWAGFSLQSHLYACHRHPQSMFGGEVHVTQPD